jgi:hypothetical protein
MNKKEQLPEKTKRSRWLYIIPGYIIVSLIIFLWCASSNPARVKEQIISILPWFLEVNFLCILIGVALHGNTLREILKDIPKKSLYILTVLVAGGILLSMFAAPMVHRIFYDENIYLNIGQTISSQEKAAMCAEGTNNYGEYHCSLLEHNKQPYGYPFLISILFRIFGAGESAGFFMNNLFFGLSILVVFLISYLLFDKLSLALYSGLVYCLIPENAIWSNTTAVEPSAALFTGLTFIAALLYCRNKNVKSLFLLFALLPFAIQFRVESIFAVPLVFLLIYQYEKQEFKSVTMYMFILLAFILLVPYIVQLYAVKDEPWGSTGPRMNLSYFMNNFKTNTLYYLKNARFPVLSTLFFLLGFLLRKDFLKERFFLSSWFFAFWGIFLFFHAGSYNYGQDVRYALVSFMPLSVLAGLGIYRLETFFQSRIQNFSILITSLIIVVFLQFMPYIRIVGEEAWSARMDHYYARKMMAFLPERSMVLTHNPNMFLLWGGNAAQAHIATNDPQKIKYFFSYYTGGVFFHYNFWCNVDDPAQQRFCMNILEKYKNEKVVEYTERNYKYILYRLKQE